MIGELIDTLWNVNIGICSWFSNNNARINRYIMECKLLKFSSSSKSKKELIDTLWNVNATVQPVAGHGNTN